jgi:hypothetical protein
MPMLIVSPDEWLVAPRQPLALFEGKMKAGTVPRHCLISCRNEAEAQ